MDLAQLRGQVDFGILAIHEDEFQSVLARFPKLCVVPSRRRYRIRQLPLPTGESYTIAVVRCVEQGTTDALNTARDLLEDLDPAFLLVVGVAGGVPAYEFTLGDVLVSTRIVDFRVEAVLQDHSREYALGGGPLHPDAAKLAADIRAMVHDGELRGWNDHKSIGIDRPLVEIADGNLYGTDDLKKDVRAKFEVHFLGKPARPPLVVTGAIASSDRLIQEAETLQVWLKIARQIQAVEMESAGVYEGAHGRQVPFLAIRGINDVVGFRCHPDWRAYACHSAAAFTRAFLLTRPIPPRARGAARFLGRSRSTKQLTLGAIFIITLGLLAAGHKLYLYHSRSIACSEARTKLSELGHKAAKYNNESARRAYLSTVRTDIDDAINQLNRCRPETNITSKCASLEGLYKEIASDSATGDDLGSSCTRETDQ